MERCRRRLRTRAGDQAGAVTGEQIGVLVIVVALVGVLVRAGLPGQLGEWSAYAACSLFSASGECERPVAAPQPGVPGGDGRTDEDFRPSACMIAQTRDAAGYEIKLSFVTFGEDFGFVRQEFSDGRVRLTVVDDASLGVAWQSGDRIIDLDKLGSDEKGGVNVSAGGGLTFGYGDTWELPNTDEEAALREHIEEWRMQHVERRHSRDGGLGSFLSRWITGRLVDPPPDPTITFSRIGLEAEVAGSAGLRSPLGPGQDGNERYLNPQIGVTLSIDGSADVLFENNRATGHTSRSYQLSASGSVTGDLVVGRGELTGTSTGSVKLTHDENGVLVGVELVTTRERAIDVSLGVRNPVQGGSGPSARVGQGESEVVVSRTVLDIDDLAHRRIVEEALGGTGDQLGTALAVTIDHAAPDRPSDDPFAQLLYEQGRSSEVVYDNVDDVQSFGLTVSAGWRVGFDAYTSTGERTVRDAHYLGAPGPDGVRPLLLDDTCG